MKRRYRLGSQLDGGVVSEIVCILSGENVGRFIAFEMGFVLTFRLESV